MKQMEWIHFFITYQLQVILIYFACPSVKSERMTKMYNFQENATEYEDALVSISTFFPTAEFSPDESLIVGQKCVEDSRLLVKSLLNQEEWALSSIFFSFPLFNVL